MTIDEQSSTQAAGANTLQLHDARPFFEKALAYGVQHGVIGADKLAAINADAPKGMVQIARYFGSEFLRPELEKARDRMVNLISLYLIDTTEGDLHQDELEAAGADAEAVIRTGLLMLALAPRSMDLGEWPNTVAFEKMLMAQRKKKLAPPSQLRLPPGLPAELREVMLAHCASVLADLPRLLDSATLVRTLLRPTGAFRARYFLLDDPLAEVDNFHRSLDALEEGEEPPLPASKTWTKTTQGNDDEHSLLTLFLCLAAGVPKKTLLTEKTAASLVRKLRKSGLQPALATEFIRTHAPGVHQQDYIALWTSVVQDAEKTLLSDMDYQMHDALALLRRECNVVG